MSSGDRSQYVDAVTKLSERELQDIAAPANPPVCLLGGWAVHLHVTGGFQDVYDRPYIGSRDIDLGIHIKPDWTTEELPMTPVATTLQQIEDELGYTRGRFGFYQQFHRETGERLSDEAAKDHPPHNIFRVDIDIIPDTTALDAFHDVFGFRPPAEPLLEPAFTARRAEALNDYVSWDAPTAVLIAAPELLAAMKVRAFPQRDKSHKRLKDLTDLHALLWYVTEYDEITEAVHTHLSDDDITAFRDVTTDEVYDRAARLIGVDTSLLSQSIERLFV
ncbi:nucleotidyl transferase AbiEii/AbiGii toxin family protein [Halomarina pelagica]|uniref:nucleotidyl transferase AbiEii/AbiGii toxin family protein n=1 Tax=Halomarina pelagica TaxID=2961599 RepID=UPI0020C1F6F3|nr:nucleotidyl transferase AbiEii/AbiGii toxin family protein [Halomarina sp. BND7]